MIVGVSLGLWCDQVSIEKAYQWSLDWGRPGAKGGAVPT